MEVTYALLTRWFSSPRMERYSSANDPVALYVWNTRMAKSFLEDVDHLEVLLRNFIADRLTADAGTPWWFEEAGRYHFNKPFQISVAKAKKRLSSRGNPVTPDGVIAEMSLDNWRFLLVPRHESTIWRALISPLNGGMANYPGRRRAPFESDVALILELRNRASHQEPFVVEASETVEEVGRLDKYTEALDRVTSRIDPNAATWIKSNSRVQEVRSTRPS